MKRFCLLMSFIILLTGTVIAQTRNNRQREPNKVTIEGTLKLERGVIAVASGENVYYIPILTRYIGFIEGLKEGSNITVEGSAFRNFIHPSKVNIGGKSYDFPEFGTTGRFNESRNNRDNFKPGHGGYGRGRHGFDPKRYNHSGFNRSGHRPGSRGFSTGCDCCSSRNRGGYRK
jgi:hypothetical protein